MNHNYNQIKNLLMALVAVLFSIQALAQSPYPYENYKGIEDPVKAKEAYYENQANQELPYYNYKGIKDNVEAKNQWYKVNGKKIASQTNGGKGNINTPEIIGNDFCGDAVPLTCGQTLSGTTVGSTFDNVGFCGTSNTANGVWYSFVGTGGNVTLSTCNQAGYDTKISVFTGTCGSLTCVTGQDDAAGCAGFTSELAFATTASTNYYVLIHGFGSATGSFNLTLSCEAPPSGYDICSEALPLTCGSSVTGSTITATFDNVGTCGTSNTTNGVWYSFVGNGGTAVLSTCGGATNYDSKLTVFSGTCNALICVDGNDDDFTCPSSIFHSRVDVSTTLGTTYYVLVHGFGSSTGDFSLSLECPDVTPPTITCPPNVVVSNDPGICGAKVCYLGPAATDNNAPNTPSGYSQIAVNGNSYYYMRSSLTDYATAEAEAIASGGHLAVITSAAENAAIAAGGGTFSFIGGNDLATDGIFVWSNCEAFNYSNFATGEPNGGASENYLEFMGGGLWNDIAGTNLRYAIIEIEGASVIQTAGLPQYSIFPVGTTTNTFVATDASGNTSTCSFDVTVNDTEFPQVMTQNIAVALSGGAASISPSDVDNGSTDNCGIVSMSVSPNSWDCDDIGLHTVTLTATDAKGNSSSNVATVEVLGIVPTSSITSMQNATGGGGWGGMDTTIVLNYGATSLQLDAIVAGGSVFSYNWIGNTAALSDPNIANPVFTETIPGNYPYTLIVTNEYGCQSISEQTLVVLDARCGKKNNKIMICHNGQSICVSPNAVAAHFINHSGDQFGSCTSKAGSMGIASISAYPNPSTGIVNIEFELFEDGDFGIEVVSPTGQVVYSEGLKENAGLHVHSIDLSALSSGVYVIRMQKEGITETQRIQLIR